MTRNANGQRIKLFTDIGVFDTEQDYQREIWRRKVVEERERQVEKGYDAAHDAEAGVEHLLNWAIDYSRRGKAIESSALILAAIELLRAADRVTVAPENASGPAGHRPETSEPFLPTVPDGPASSIATVAPDREGEPSNDDMRVWNDGHGLVVAVYHEGSGTWTTTGDDEARTWDEVEARFAGAVDWHPLASGVFGVPADQR